MEEKIIYESELGRDVGVVVVRDGLVYWEWLGGTECYGEATDLNMVAVIRALKELEKEALQNMTDAIATDMSLKYVSYKKHQ